MHPKKINSIVPRRLSSVQVVDNDINFAIKSWKKILKENQTIEGLYERKFYKKPSQRKRLQKQIAVYLQTKELD